MRLGELADTILEAKKCHFRLSVTWRSREGHSEVHSKSKSLRTNEVNAVTLSEAEGLRAWSFLWCKFQSPKARGPGGLVFKGRRRRVP